MLNIILNMVIQFHHTYLPSHACLLTVHVFKIDTAIRKPFRRWSGIPRQMQMQKNKACHKYGLLDIIRVCLCIHEVTESPTSDLYYREYRLPLNNNDHWESRMAWKA